MTLLAETALDEVRLARSDVDEVYRLYLSALARLPNPAAVRPDEPAFFEEIFDVGGEIVGFRDGPALIAYGVLRPVLDSEHDRKGLGHVVPADAPLMVLDGSAVGPAYWKRGLQRAIIETRIAEAARLGASHVIAKASPANIPSMRNLLKRGFATVALVRKPYGWRYVNHRPVAAALSQPAGCEWMDAGRIDEAQARFAAGEAAFACEADEIGGARLAFAARLERFSFILAHDVVRAFAGEAQRAGRAGRTAKRCNAVRRAPWRRLRWPADAGWTASPLAGSPATGCTTLLATLRQRAIEWVI